MTEQRRLAAIVSADVAGYARLMGRDESGTLAALKALRLEIIDPGIAKHNGRIVKTTGDGLLLEFASVIDAVRCVIDVQTAMAEKTSDVPQDRRITFRVGVNIGDIIVDGDDIFGDGVNIAARLQEIAQPGGICTSGRVHDDIRDRLDTTFEDGGTQTLKNIARPVQVWRWTTSNPPASASVPPPADVPLALPDKPSIAVLPFQNMSGDPEQEYFADGMVEEIITALSRFKSLFVIARNSSFTYKGKAVDIKQVGLELGVRYVLEGSVRKAGGRVRITGQLIEAASGMHLWADRFDGDLSDVFELQDKVTASVVSVIAPKIQQNEIERARIKPTARLDGYDCFMRGMAAYADRAKWRTSEPLDWFRRACELDPRYPAAQIMIAFSLQAQQTASGVPLAAEVRAEALRISEHACQLASADPFVLARAAHLLSYFGRIYDRSEGLIEHAIALNPNDATAWSLRGWISVMCVEPTRAIESFERQLQLSPIDPRRATVWNGMAFAHYQSGAYGQGRDIAAKALELGVDAHTLCALSSTRLLSAISRKRVSVRAACCRCDPTFAPQIPVGSFQYEGLRWLIASLPHCVLPGFPNSWAGKVRASVQADLSP